MNWPREERERRIVMMLYGNLHNILSEVTSNERHPPVGEMSFEWRDKSSKR